MFRHSVNSVTGERILETRAPTYTEYHLNMLEKIIESLSVY